MTSQQAAAMVQAINSVQLYVPPILFSALAASEAAIALLAIARGQTVCFPSGLQAPLPITGDVE